MRSQDTLLPSLSRATSRSVSDRSESRADRNLISQLTQAQRENDELRREVSAQTSMLTSRNREKERLYAEIEDLKLTMRGGGLGVAVESASRAPSVFSDRGLDRSVSRAGGAASATGTNVSAVTENEREDFENTNGALRDRISELRLKNQDLEQQVEACFMEIEQRQIEMNQLEDELEVAHAEVQEMQLERNDALKMREEIEQEFQQLKEEAEDELHRLEDELDARTDEVMRFQEDGRLKDEDFGGLQQELRNVSDIVVRLEDQQEAHHIEVSRLEGRIQELERTIHEGEQEMSVLENSLREANEKIERLTVQSESAKGEIAFLREEQDVDKIKIGELHGVISKLEAELEDEKDKVHEAQEQMETEREKREQHGDQRKQEWERRYEERSEELTKSKEEVRKLKTKVCSREDEARNWRERLEELERGLRDALGDLGGTKLGLAQVRSQPSSSSGSKKIHTILQAVVNLQAELDGTLEELDFTKNELTEKDRNLKERENLLESMALENRKLTDLLEKERNSHRQNKSHLETLQSSHHHTSRRITQHQQQQSELEKQRNRETKNLKNLEDAFREQLTERNNLLMQIWQRLSAVCGKDWANRNAMVTAVNTGKLPMDSAIISAFPAFSRNLISAVKTIESIVAGFKTKCRGVERDLWKEYQVVESALEARTRRIERLEGLIRGGMGETNSQVRSEIAKLRSENRMLKVEINVMKQDNAAASAAAASAAAQNIPNSPSSTPSNFNKSFSEKRSMQAAAASAASSGIGATPPTTADSSPALPASKSPAIGSGHHRNSSNHGSNHRNSLTAARNDSNGASGSGSNGTGNSGAPSSADGGEKRWILRLRELEKRLKQEREARMLDRSMANKKIQETKGEKEEIRRELERERIKSEK